MSASSEAPTLAQASAELGAILYEPPRARGSGTGWFRVYGCPHGGGSHLTTVEAEGCAHALRSRAKEVAAA